MKPLRPASGHWFSVSPPEQMEDVAEGWCWRERGLLVLSTLSKKDDLCYYHLSISRFGGHCSTDEAMEILRMFGMEWSEEFVRPEGSLSRHFLQPFEPVNE